MAEKTTTKKKTKPPIVQAQIWIEKQAVQIAESKLPAPQKTQIGHWLKGLLCVAKSFGEAVDVANPPAPNTVHGMLIALGKSQSAMVDVLAIMGGEATGGSEDEGEDGEDEAPPSGAPAGQRAAAPALI